MVREVHAVAWRNVLGRRAAIQVRTEMRPDPEPPKAAEDTNRGRSFEATRRLAETLVEQPQFKALIRRMVYLEASAAPDGFVFEPRFRFG